VKAGGFTVTTMSAVAAAIYGIYAVTTALAGVFSDRWIRDGGSPTRVRKAFLLSAGIGSAVTIASCAYVPVSTAVWLLAATGVFFGLATPMIFAVGATLSGPRAAGRWAGAQNLAGQLAGVVAPVVTGLIVDRTGSFSLAFVVSAAAAAFAALSWGLIIRQVAPVEWPDAVPPSLAVAPAPT
jgi:MFS family permease